MGTGDLIKKHRKELKLSADYVADKLGISRSTIFRYENGDIDKVPADILEPLAEILMTTPAELMGWENKTENSLSGLYLSFAKDAEKTTYTQKILRLQLSL